MGSEEEFRRLVLGALGSIVESRGRAREGRDLSRGSITRFG